MVSHDESSGCRKKYIATLRSTAEVYRLSAVASDRMMVTEQQEHGSLRTEYWQELDKTHSYMIDIEAELNGIAKALESAPSESADNILEDLESRAAKVQEDQTSGLRDALGIARELLQGKKHTPLPNAFILPHHESTREQGRGNK